LTPSKEKLVNFASDWARELEKFGRPPTPVLGARPRPTPRVGSLEEIAKQLDTPDRAKANGTSIAFAISYRRNSALFLGDAHPDDMAGSLNRLAMQPGRLEFDLIKVAHHGSARNNTSALIAKLDSRLWC
jgi:hypothetical protein